MLAAVLLCGTAELAVAQLGATTFQGVPVPGSRQGGGETFQGIPVNPPGSPYDRRCGRDKTYDVQSRACIQRSIASGNSPFGVPANAFTFYVDALGGYGGASNEFKITPPFSVNGSGGFAEIGAGVRIPFQASNVFFDARVSGLFGNLGGDAFYAPSGGIYTVRQNAMGLVEAGVGVYLPDVPFLNRRYGESAFSARSAGAKWSLSAPDNPFAVVMIGFYQWYADVDGRGAAFQARDTASAPGMTASFRLGVPINQYLKAIAQVRYNHSAEAMINIPGGLKTFTNQYYIGAGLSFDLNSLPPPIDPDKYRVM